VATLKKYDLDGKEIAKVTIEDENLQNMANPQMIKDYLVALSHNKRQWSANTRGRKEINRTGAKPHKQKGTGRARQGCFAAPQYRGGGIVFGPKPKFDQHIRINKKEKLAVIRTLIIEKIKSDNAIVLELNDGSVDKTKQIATFFNTMGMVNKRVLVLSKPKNATNFQRCIRNIPKKELVNIVALNGRDLALCQNLVIIDSVLDDAKAILNKGVK
jgi:large subunit ribosomal protein L4